jgi:hypothetical protein
MLAIASSLLVPEQAEATPRGVYTTLYDLIAAVREAIEPGEEDLVVPIVRHVLRAGRGRCLRDVDMERAMCWDAQAAPACLEAEACWGPV